jgi:ketosteroid isomerase-like protein
MNASAEDRLAIIELVTSADAAATARDVDGYLACFTDDARMTGTMGDYQGKEAIRQSVSPIWASEGDTTVHLSLNVQVDDTSQSGLVARSILLILKAGPPVGIIGMAAITQNVVKVGDEWKVHVRAIANVGHPS